MVLSSSRSQLLTMDKWTSLEPVKLYSSATNRLSAIATRNKLTTPAIPYIGPLPVDIHIRILNHLPIPHIPSYARVSRALARLAAQDSFWKTKCDALRLEHPIYAGIITDLHKSFTDEATTSTPPVLNVQNEEDDFGDFASAPLSARQFLDAREGEMGGFIGGPNSTFSQPTSRGKYIQAHLLLSSLAQLLKSPPHLILSTLFPPPTPPPPRQQARILHLLSLFLSQKLQPISEWPDLRRSLLSTMDRFEANLLTSFDSATAREDETAMSEAAWASWEVWDASGTSPEWELGKVWTETREIFYEGGQWDPLKNVMCVFAQLHYFTCINWRAVLGPMVTWHSRQWMVLSTTLSTHYKSMEPSQSAFSPQSRVFSLPLPNGWQTKWSVIRHMDGFRFLTCPLIQVAEYVTPLLSHARALEHEQFLQASAATFIQSWRIVDVLMEVGHPTPPQGSAAEPSIVRIQAEDVMYEPSPLSESIVLMTLGQFPHV